MTQPAGFKSLDQDGFDEDLPLSAAQLQHINANWNDLATSRLNAATMFFWQSRLPRLFGLPTKFGFLLPPWPLTPGATEITLTIGYSHPLYGSTILSAALLTPNGLTALQDPQTVAFSTGHKEIVLDVTGHDGWLRILLVAESTEGSAITVASGNVDAIRPRWVRLTSAAGVSTSYTYLLSWDETAYNVDRLPPDALLLKGDVNPSAGEYYQFIWPPYDWEDTGVGLSSEPDFVGKQGLNLKRIGHLDLKWIEVRETASALVETPQEAYKAGKLPSARAMRDLASVADRLKRTHTSIVAYGGDLDFNVLDPDDSTRVLRPTGTGVEVHYSGSMSWTTFGAFYIGNFGATEDVVLAATSYQLAFMVAGTIGVFSTFKEPRDVIVRLRAHITDPDDTGTSRTSDELTLSLESVPWHRDSSYDAVSYLETFSKELEHYDRVELDHHVARGVWPLPDSADIGLWSWGLYAWELPFTEIDTEAAATVRQVQLQMQVDDGSKRRRGYPEYVLVPHFTAVERRLQLTR